MSPPSAGEEIWSFRAPAGGTIMGQPLVAGGSVFFTRGDTLYELDRDTGALRSERRFVPRRGFGRLFPGRRNADFEATHGIPMLSRAGNHIVVSCHDPDGGVIDFAVDLASGEESLVEGGFDPMTAQAAGGIRLSIDGNVTGKMPVLCAEDAEGHFLWDSRWAETRGFASSDWLSAIGRPVPAGDRVLFGVAETTVERGTPIGYRLMALRLADGSELWERINRATDRTVLGTGFDGRWFWVLVLQRDGVPLLRFHDPEDGEPRHEARFPGLTGGVAIADDTLYGGFGRSLVAVRLTLA